jgi:hypothetical protein
MLVQRYMTYKDDLWGLDWLGKEAITYSLLKRSCRVKFSPSYRVPFAPWKLTCHRVRSLLGRLAFIYGLFFWIDSYSFCRRLLILSAIFLFINSLSILLCSHHQALKKSSIKIYLLLIVML